MARSEFPKLSSHDVATCLLAIVAAAFLTIFAGGCGENSTIDSSTRLSAISIHSVSISDVV